MSVWSVVVAGVVLSLALIDVDQGTAPSTPAPLQPEQTAQQTPQMAPADDPIQDLVARLDLEKYKATIKGLTQFGDRKAGTDRNRAAIDWIEAQLKSYGCPTERIKYDYVTPQRGQRGRGTGAGQRGGRGRAVPGEIAKRPGGGGSMIFGRAGRTGVNNDPNAQPDEKLRALNSQPATDGPREEVYCTKVGTKVPGEMYIISAHMDGLGWGEAANDDGSGTALVMELARILNSPDVQTERSIRFALWNNEESGLDGARAYVAQREALQGREDPPGSGKYPEPKWLGMIQHDMMLFDHGMPGPDGKPAADQRPEADVNIEFQMTSKMAAESQRLAWLLKAANEKYATDYPAAVGPHMSNTDSTPFMDSVPAVSLRENERGSQIGGGWDPHWHQPTDVFATFSDKDFRLGLNAAQTTLGALGQLAGVSIRR
jgi:Peptidase family M28